MNDIRRNLLWGVFLVSLFLIYDAWNKYNGQPSLFDRPHAAAPATAPAGSAPLGNGVPTPSSTPAPPRRWQRRHRRRQ